MSATRDKAPMTLSETLQRDVRTDWWRDRAPPATFDDILKSASPRLQWPYKTKPPAFIRQEITGADGPAFLKLPPILYLVSFKCITAVNMLRYTVETLEVEINAEYDVADANGVIVGSTTPLGWFLYVMSWNPEHYDEHTPMLAEMLRMGADPNAPVMTDFNALRRRRSSPLCAALVRQFSMTFAKLLMEFGATFSTECDRAPLVAAMRRHGCIPMVELFKDNVVALGGTQNDHTHDEAGDTAMHYFIERGLNSRQPMTSEAFKRGVAILNKKLRVLMNTENDFGWLPSALVNRAAQRAAMVADRAETPEQSAAAAEQMAIMQDLLDFVLDLEKHEPRFMTVAAESVTNTLPTEVASHVHHYVGQDTRFAKRRMGAGS